MGIQINGNTNNINAGIGSLSIEDINELDIVGVATAANFKTGVSNLHDVGLTLSGGQIDVGSNIKLGNAGVVTATSFVGSGANLTSLPAGQLTGTVADARISTLTASKLTGALPAIDGSNLTGITVPGGGTGLDLNDGVKLRLGTGNDVEFYHASNQNVINYINGNLVIKKATNSISNSIQFDGNGHMYVPDDDTVYFGSSADLTLSHRSSDESAVIKANNSTGFLRILAGVSNSGGILLKNKDDDVTYLRARNEQAVELFYANNQKFLTTSGGVAVYDQLSVGTAAVQQASVASFVGGAYNQVNIADGSNSGWGLLLAQQQGTNNSSLYTYSTNSSTNKPCAVVNVNNDCIHFATNNTPRFRIEHDGHVIPSYNAGYDLGSSTYRWRNIYINDLNLSNEGSTNIVDNTWGDWTLQEGENDVFMINNRSGKKFKIKMEEVE